MRDSDARFILQGALRSRSQMFFQIGFLKIYEIFKNTFFYKTPVAFSKN